MKIGYVRWFNSEKGYGFIQTIPKVGESEIDLFVHYKDIAGEGFRLLERGQIVEFDVEAGEQGSVARNVNIDVEEGLLIQRTDALVSLVKKFGFRVKADKDEHENHGDRYDK